MVYLCDGRTQCEGWADRQRGITNLYMLAHLTGRQFKIIMNTPCDISNFYVPGPVQWIPTDSELNTSSNLTLNLFNKSVWLKFQEDLRTGDFNKEHSENVIYIKTNRMLFSLLQHNPFYSHKFLNWNRHRDVFKWAWNDLMQVSGQLLQKLSNVLGLLHLRKHGYTLNSNYSSSFSKVNYTHLICSHVRFGKNPDNPNDKDIGGFDVKYLPALMNHMKVFDVDKRSRFFLATDYEYLREEFHKFFTPRVISTGVKVMHVDKDRNLDGACQGFEGALLEQLILSSCDVLFISIPKRHTSGFSKYAVLAAKKTPKTFSFVDGVIGGYNKYMF